MKTKTKSRKKWLFIAVGILLVFVVGKTCYNSRSDTDREDIAPDQEVEFHFNGRPKVGEPYLISMNTRQVRTCQTYSNRRVLSRSSKS